MQATIPRMREQRRGKIVNITSMGGRIAVPLDSMMYHGTKFAREGVSESLQYEIEPFGIKIILIEHGAVGSCFRKKLKIASKTASPDNIDSPYQQIVNSKMFQNHHSNKCNKIQYIHLSCKCDSTRSAIG